MNEPQEFLGLVGDIIQSEMELSPEQVVFVDEKFDIPSDERVYVALALMGSREFGAKTEYRPDPATGELVETQAINRQEMYSIVLYSRSRAAAVRNWEVPAALNSTLSQQTQEKFSFKIANIPSSMNKVPDPDGTARLTKYALTVLALVAYQKSKAVDFFDKFSQPLVHTNQ